ncbi:MAG: hypothetical protein ACRDHO_10015 [Actinomycetota bacterium]
MDGFVLLTPVLVLVVILLLGFTGCDVVLGLEPPGTLTLKARVPSQFTILEARFEWTAPGGSLQSDNEPDRKNDGPDIIELSHLIGTPAKGSWTAFCRLRVRQPTPTGAGREAVDDETGTFTVDSTSEDSSAVFETSGSPAGLNFRVLFTGLVTE